MKEITAVIRMKMVNQTKQALADIDIPSLTVRKVEGRGNRNVDYTLLRGAEEGHEEAIAQLGASPRLWPKRMLTIVVPDERAQEVIATIIKVNQTGNMGDGKIFVQTMTDAYRVRTGEQGEDALT